MIQSDLLKDCLEQDLSHAGIDTTLKLESTPDLSLRQAFGLSIHRSLLKKFVGAVAADADAKARDKFLACNEKCERWELQPLTSKHDVLVGEVKSIINDFWFGRGGYALTDSPLQHFHAGRCGPGASVSSRDESFYSKLFSSPLVASNSALLYWYDHYIKRFPEWANAEIIRTLTYGSPSVVASSRLSFVPKNDEISRCIVIGPNLDTMFQLGFATFIERRLSELFGIALPSQQPKNRGLARLGSITDGLSTLDLSSASDLISYKLVKYLLPADFFRQLELYRSTHVEVPGRGSVKMSMFSTMGNGFTFPLQTLIFTAVVCACLRFRGIPRFSNESSELWGVNGDDIIVPRTIARDVIEVLNLFGFEVNADKSFVEGPFRESCGGDYWRGTLIRGVYIKRLKSQSDFYVAINLLFRFSARSGIDLPRTIAYLMSFIRRPLYVPRWENLDAGLHVPLSSVRDRLKWDADRYGYFYTCLRPRATYVRFGDGTVSVPPGRKGLIYNPSGLLVSVIANRVKGTGYAVRTATPKYLTKRYSTSSWDSLRPGSILDSGTSRWESNDFCLDWGGWETLVDNYLKR